MSIYDRSTWPDPEANPLLALYESDRDWFTNGEISAALGYTSTKKSLIAQWPSLAEQLGNVDTAIRERGMLIGEAARQPRGGGLERHFSRKALVLIAMRAQTANAAAFCDWLAGDLALWTRVERAFDH